VNGTLYFSADNGVKGMELWKTDGTSTGTVLVKDIWSGSNESYPFDLAAIGNTLYFSADNGSSGTELWKSDGTSAGTTIVKDIWSGSNSGYPYDLVNIGGTLYFSANNGSSGIELWKSDGTTSGTSLVKDVWPGSQSGAVGNFEKFVNKLVFTGNDGINGFKTWQSDGTVAGTQMATGIVDVGGGTLEDLVETDWKIFASINQTATGSELWAVNFSVVLPLDMIDFKADLVQQDAVLNWKTANEKNTLEFIVERSVNGNNYEPVGRVASGATGNYSYIDKNITGLKTTTVYYRLRQVDVDSRFTYSKIVTLDLKGVQHFTLYPNPATGSINLQAGNISSGNIRYKIFDNAGKIILQSSGQVSTNGRVSIDINTLAKGVYYLDLNANPAGNTMQFIKR
jgi:ELWxxDGT repeat protein